jgi:predicted DCC family thiol-disulfide oxidoreductase YuxK
MQKSHNSTDQLNAPHQDADVVITTVFYDGNCPLCRREIDHYRRLRSADKLIWVDINKDQQMLAAHGLEHDVAMARFHVLDASGKWQTGAWGFIELWSHLPAYRWLASLLRMLRCEKALDWIYTRFARRRLQHRCNQGGCSTG